MNEKLIWFILDEIAIACSSRHIGRSCSICDRVIEAMRLIKEKPSSIECQEYYNQRKSLYK